MTTIPQTMRAWVYRRSGPVEKVLKLETDYPMTPLKNYPIIVKNKCVALNPVAFKIMSEIPFFITMKPGIPEQDFAGVVVGGDLSGSDFEVGDEVFGAVPADKGQMPAGRGVLADYTCARSSLLAHKPTDWSFAQASSITLTGITAHHVLVNRAKVQAGERVLINGGTSGVGALAIQMAKILGCHVVVTCSKQSFDLVKSLGADEIIDYKEINVTENLAIKHGKPDTQFDVIFDTIGVTELYSHSKKYLKPHGRFLSISMDTSTVATAISSALHIAWAKLTPTWLGGPPAHLQLVMLNMEEESESLRQIRQWMGEGKLKPVIDSEFSFEDAQAAYAKIQSHRAKGKIIINL